MKGLMAEYFLWYFFIEINIDFCLFGAARVIVQVPVNKLPAMHAMAGPCEAAYQLTQR